MDAEQYRMAEFLALVAIGAVGVSQDGRCTVARDGMPYPSPELDPPARRADGAGWTIEVLGCLGLTGPGRATLRHLRTHTTGAVPDDAEYHRRVMEHDQWIRSRAPQAFGAHREAPAAPARPAPPARSLLDPPTVPPPVMAPPGGRTGSLLFVPLSAGRSWTIELAALADPSSLRAALSDAQCHELRELVERLRALLDAPGGRGPVGPVR